MIHSVRVKAEMEPGIPGLVVEVAILPKQRVFEKSHVYSTGEPDVDITLKETFKLSCTQVDIEESTLFLVVKPINSGTVLYAENQFERVIFKWRKRNYPWRILEELVLPVTKIIRNFLQHISN